MTDEPARLGDLPGLTLSQRAVETYRDAVGLDPHETETARRELLRWLLDARLTHAAVGDTPAAYRRRSRRDGVDISARVVEDEGLHVVVSVSVRSYPTTGERNREVRAKRRGKR